MKTRHNKVLICMALFLSLSNVSFISSALGEVINEVDSGRKPASDSEPVVEGSIERSPQRVCLGLTLPAQFSIKALTADSKYRVAVMDSNNKAVAYIRQSSLSSGRFEVFDLNDALVMIGREKITSVGSEVQLFDCNGVKIGTIKQDVEKSFLSAAASYSVRDEKGNLVFVTEKKDEDSKFISILDKNQTELASMLVVGSQKKYEADSKQASTGREALLFLATVKVYSNGIK